MTVKLLLQLQLFVFKFTIVQWSGGVLEAALLALMILEASLPGPLALSLKSLYISSLIKQLTKRNRDNQQTTNKCL